MQQSMLVFREFRYLRVALLLCVAVIAVYAWHDPLAGANGGSWYGYTLGTIGALLILWLAWFGIRKRRYGIGQMTLQEWLSAHIYLGVSLIIIATLHTGFQFGFNLHTLAYGLMRAVIVSEPECGVATTLSRPTSWADTPTGGSDAWQSNPAPAS